MIWRKRAKPRERILLGVAAVAAVALLLVLSKRDARWEVCGTADPDSRIRACTAIIDGKAVYSCTTLAIDAQGKNIETIEGFTSDTRMHPVSAAFVQHDAQQCGYCTPGFVVAAKNFLDRHPNPTFEEVEKGLGGNLCRCGTYVGVRMAVLEAAKNMKGGSRG